MFRFEAGTLGHMYDSLSFATCTSPRIHLVCPPKFCISIVANFSWDLCNTQEKWKTKVMQNFGGQTRCIMGDVQMANVDNSMTAHSFDWLNTQSYCAGMEGFSKSVCVRRFSPLLSLLFASLFSSFPQKRLRLRPLLQRTYFIGWLQNRNMSVVFQWVCRCPV